MYMQILESMHARSICTHIIHGHTNTQKHAHTHSLCMHTTHVNKHTLHYHDFICTHTQWHTQPYVHNAHIHILQWHTHTHTPSLSLSSNYWPESLFDFPLLLHDPHLLPNLFCALFLRQVDCRHVHILILLGLGVIICTSTSATTTPVVTITSFLLLLLLLMV